MQLEAASSLRIRAILMLFSYPSESLEVSIGLDVQKVIREGLPRGLGWS